MDSTSPTGEAQPVELAIKAYGEACQIVGRTEYLNLEHPSRVAGFKARDKARRELDAMLAALPDQHGEKCAHCANPATRRFCEKCYVDALQGQHGEPIRNEEVARVKAAQLLTLNDNWDSYGGAKITADAVDAALRLRDAMATEPSLVPMSNGGVQVEWHTHGFDVELVLRPDGSLETEEPEHGEPTEAMVEAKGMLVRWLAVYDSGWCQPETAVEELAELTRVALTTKRGQNDS